MKFSLIATAVALSALTTNAESQVVGHRAPVVVPAEFVSSSSPAADGRVVTTYSNSVPSNEPTGIISPTSFSSQPTLRYASQSAYIAQSPPIAAEAPPTLLPQSQYGPPQYGPSRYGAPLSNPGTDPCACAPAGGGLSVAPQQFGAVYPPMQVYRPATVIATKPVPAGTYVGKGLIGQVKAYVDGQPVRNFIRYILP